MNIKDTLNEALELCNQIQRAIEMGELEQASAIVEQVRPLTVEVGKFDPDAPAGVYGRALALFCAALIVGDLNDALTKLQMIRGLLAANVSEELWESYVVPESPKIGSALQT